MLRMLAPLLVLVLTACGSEQDDGAAKASAPVPTSLSDVEKAEILASLPAPYNGADLENGARAFARCRSCHTITPNGPNMTGPNLYGVFGRRVGSHEGYGYSNALKSAEFIWDAGRLDHWLQNPRSFLPGNKMTFAGLPDPDDRRDVIAFLKVETGQGPGT